jgi:uncharacterized protein (TIGR03000 family)
MRTRAALCLGLALISSTASFGNRRAFGGLFAGIFRGHRGCVVGNYGNYQGYQNVYYGGSSCGVISNCMPCIPTNPAPITPKPGCCEPKKPDEITPPPAQVAENRAYIILEGVPTGAVLTLDGIDYTKPGVATDMRVFRTPPLKAGKFKTQFVVKYLTAPNQMATGAFEAVYQANERARVNLKQFAFQVAAISPRGPASIGAVQLAAHDSTKKLAAATLQWDVPVDAEVFLDGKLVVGADQQTITTPPLDPDKRYTFDVAVKYPLEGRTVAFEKNVEFVAGEKVVMGLTETGPVKIAFAQYPEQVQLASK